MEDQPAHHRQRYDPTVIEPRWQKRWAEDSRYRVDSHEPGEARHVMSTGPYPSGPTHMGHIRSYTCRDVVVRYNTMAGWGVASGVEFAVAIAAEDGSERTAIAPLTGLFTVTRGQPIDAYGVDPLRLAILQAKPPDEDIDFEHFRVEGCQRFLHRLWRLAATDTGDIRRVRRGPPASVDHDIDAATHRLIDRVTGEYDRLAFNTAVAGFMEFTNGLYAYVQSTDGPHGSTLEAAVDTLLVLMAPAVPHITAELWSRRHDGQHIHEMSWPKADPATSKASTTTMVVQVNGKLRDRIEVSADITAADALATAVASERVQLLLDGRSPSRTIVRQPALVNLVV